ncbi:hypothetical protein [Parendozoicomonas haliclonae]|uniref:Uncharacterized protein n=1 Tax=Parendozoicomonas haliclonae TaxID=1960125 RepID=A0A1X7AMG4_9GAMM|nr:hypothetical protein [Parendozoicomonas haliclonae]SMA49095.1 hypothetical protein EHSB41UT_03045 [Parendozoicomonas haliclonae]
MDMIKGFFFGGSASTASTKGETSRSKQVRFEQWETESTDSSSSYLSDNESDDEATHPHKKGISSRLMSIIREETAMASKMDLHRLMNDFSSYIAEHPACDSSRQDSYYTFLKENRSKTQCKELLRLFTDANISEFYPKAKYPRDYQNALKMRTALKAGSKGQYPEPPKPTKKAVTPKALSRKERMQQLKAEHPGREKMERSINSAFDLHMDFMCQRSDPYASEKKQHKEYADSRTLEQCQHALAFLEEKRLKKEMSGEYSVFLPGMRELRKVLENREQELLQSDIPSTPVRKRKKF